MRGFNHSIIAAILTLSSVCVAGTRFEQYTEKFRDTPDQAKVIAATCFGGSGVEWFAGGGFQPDGTVVAAGTTLGPTFDAPVNVTVLGKDNAPPEAPVQVQSKKAAKDGSVKYDRFVWTHPNATGFVVRYSADMKKVLSASRLPWTSAGITSAAVDSAGGIYIAGPASDDVTRAFPGAKELPVQVGDQKGEIDHAYLAKLSPDGGKIVWLVHVKGPSSCPSVKISKAGAIIFRSTDLRVFNPNGQQQSVIVVPGGLSGNVAVNPIDGTYARGGEHHWPTGREPYRCPTLNIYKPNGELLYELYNWAGPYVGLDNLRLVSDSAVRGVQFDDDGNLLIQAWSDGGNSVMQYHPNDVRTAHGAFERSLGFSPWGAGVLSATYIIKIETKNYKVIDGTLWLAFLKDKDKPNSTTIEIVSQATDGSICFAGATAWGLIRTGNEISGGAPPAGPYAAVLSSDFKRLRFSSNLPACGQSNINGDSFAIASGTANGKARVMILSGAIESETSYEATKSPPHVNAVQPTFGGGALDAHIVVLDLSKE